MNNPSFHSSRRNFLGKAGLALGAAAAATVLRPGIARAVSPALTFADIPGTGDIKVLNYALALEDLEADLYAQAFLRLGSGGTNALGTSIPGLNVPKGDDDYQYIQEFGAVETEHRDFLRTTLGSSAITQYKYDFQMESQTRRSLLTLIYTAEALGTSAYLGAIPFFATFTYLQIAGAIQGTEARHTATIAEILFLDFNDGVLLTPPYNSNSGIDTSNTPDTVLATISPFIVIS